MFQSRPSEIPGRRHKTVAVDFGNEFLRYYLREVHCRAHRARLDAARARAAEWAARSRAAEAAAASAISAVGAANAAEPRPLAAVFDIDEVVLANIHANEDAASGFHAADYFEAPGGGPWPRGDLRFNPLMRGARELLEELARCGVAVFFVTGRLESVRAETVANFAHVGLADSAGGGAAAGAAPPSPTAFPLFGAAELGRPDGPLRMCADGEYPPLGESVRPYKERRRREIEATHRIMLNVGDQASDLGSGDVQLLLPHPFYYIM